MPENVVSAPSVQTFESRLDKAWNDQPIKFNYKEELRLYSFMIWSDKEVISSCVQNSEEDDDDDDDDDAVLG